MDSREKVVASHERLLQAIQKDSQQFQEYYLWLEKAMPPDFFDEVCQENIILIAHSLIGFNLQEYFCTIHLHHAGIAISLNTPDADLRILSHYATHGIKNYRAFVSLSPPPFPGITTPLRIVMLHFTEAIETVEAPYPADLKNELRTLVKQSNPALSDNEFELLISSFNTRFLKSLPTDRLLLAFNMYFRAQTRDNCQYEVRYDQEWATTGQPSMQIVLAWRNAPKYHFLYRLARTIFRHGLVMQRVNTTYVNPYTKNNILVMSLGLHGSKGEAAWDLIEIPDFLRELVTSKFFASFDAIDNKLVHPGIVTGGMGNFLRAAKSFVHQSLVHIDVNLYSLPNIEEALYRYPDFTAAICEAFKYKFDPDNVDLDKHHSIAKTFFEDISKIDTDHEQNDIRRKNVLKQAMNFIVYCLKTNFYRYNNTSLSFRLDPKYMEELPFDRTTKFPELPFAIFFIKGLRFFGFHIRFKDLARGGLRTVFPEHSEHMQMERDQVFTECYNLALTQQKKNKDIPEGGAKGIIFLKPFEQLESEASILKKELELSKVEAKEIEDRIATYRKEQTREYLYHAQRTFIEGFLPLINCEADGTLKAKYIIDYWKKPEYIYLGPDENMHDAMIEWIAAFSVQHGYKPGSCFMSSKPHVGINHKEYGVTSLGVNIYMAEVLKYTGVDPEKDSFTVKLSGGPDGDVAGNQILNLHRYYPNTAKIVALTDVSGTIYDPKGLNLETLADLFKKGKPIRFYPPKYLSNEAFLIDRTSKKKVSAFVEQILCYKAVDGRVIEEWLSGNEAGFIIRNNVHTAKADVFIPAGGRPRTLNGANYRDFLDESGIPSSRIIIEGANLYLTPDARRALEKLGVLIIKDSSANKTGVICSSFEILAGLTLGDKEFSANKEALVKEIMERLAVCVRKEARLLLETYRDTGQFLTALSDKVSENINKYTYQILDYLETRPLSQNVKDPMIQCFLDYCLPTLREKYQAELLKEIPEQHKKAIIACHIAADMVYKKGLAWEPTIVDILYRT
jgi:glutamate dehydrogenase